MGTKKNCNCFAKGGRMKPQTSKAGFTKSSKRRYGSGGKVKK